jgi:subtilase family serine protease
MDRMVWKLLGSSVSTLALLASAAAASPGPVERSGSTFHVAVCGQSVGHAARCHAHVVTDEAGRILANRLTPAGTPAGYGAVKLRTAYNVRLTGASTTLVAIVDAYGYTNAEADLAAYRAQFGLPACTTANGCFRKLNQTGVAANYPAQDLGWAQESALDLDMASAMCPNCRLYLIEANSNAFSNLVVAEATAARLGAHAISNSYGVAEANTQSYEAAYNHPGIAITASTGDTGYGVEFPASSPHVIAVGGTHLVTATNSRGWSESVWPGAGSGCSTVYAKPRWQVDAGCRMRTVADTAAVADPRTGVSVYGPVSTRGSGWMIFGGTSAAAPLIAGIYGARASVVSYASGLYSHTSYLFDVSTGSNGSCGGSYLCTGKVNYDGPTGLGTPNGTSAY